MYDNPDKLTCDRESGYVFIMQLISPDLLCTALLDVRFGVASRLTNSSCIQISRKKAIGGFGKDWNSK
jgi:hypothetical protein